MNDRNWWVPSEHWNIRGLDDPGSRLHYVFNGVASTHQNPRFHPGKITILINIC